MATENLTPSQALRGVQETAPWVAPNPGFWRQLELFKAMGYKVDDTFEPYRALLRMQQRQLAALNTRPLPKLCQVRHFSRNANWHFDNKFERECRFSNASVCCKATFAAG